MKAFFYLAVLAVVIASGCSKESDSKIDPGPGPDPIGDTTKKDTISFFNNFDTVGINSIDVTEVYVEYFSGTPASTFHRHCQNFKQAMAIYTVGDTAKLLTGKHVTVTLAVCGFFNPPQTYYLDITPSSDQEIAVVQKTNTLSWKLDYHLP